MSSERSEPSDASEPTPADAPDPRESAYGLLQRGQELIRGRHHAQAATVLARAARLEPRKGSILEALGRAYYNSGQHGRAAETFELLLDVDPSARFVDAGGKRVCFAVLEPGKSGVFVAELR